MNNRLYLEGGTDKKHEMDNKLHEINLITGKYISYEIENNATNTSHHTSIYLGNKNCF